LAAVKLKLSGKAQHSECKRNIFSSKTTFLVSNRNFLSEKRNKDKIHIHGFKVLSVFKDAEGKLHVLTLDASPKYWQYILNVHLKGRRIS
jgi:hypothetical protein